MIKQQIEIIIVFLGRVGSDLQMILRTEKGKALSQFEQKIAQMLQQPALQLPFAGRPEPMSKKSKL